MDAGGEITEGDLGDLKGGDRGEVSPPIRAGGCGFSCLSSLCSACCLSLSSSRAASFASLNFSTNCVCVRVRAHATLITKLQYPHTLSSYHTITLLISSHYPHPHNTLFTSTHLHTTTSTHPHTTTSSSLPVSSPSLK